MLLEQMFSVNVGRNSASQSRGRCEFRRVDSSVGPAITVGFVC